jgi:hypothetical protein
VDKSDTLLYMATKISELLNIFLAREEDKTLSLLAEERMKGKTKKVSHADIWGA